MATDILRFSRRVPDSGINLCWIRLPQLSPLENLSLVETGRYIAENIPLGSALLLGSGVIGVTTRTATLTGLAFLTTYNNAPSGTSLLNQISTGAAVYSEPRLPTTSVLPSGFVLQGFTAPIRLTHAPPDDTGVWRLRVQDGLIARRYVLASSDQSWLKQLFTPGDDLMLYYSVVEAQQLPYTTLTTDYEDARVVDVSGRLAQVLDDHTLQLPATDLFEVRSLTVNGQELITSASGQLAIATAVSSGNVPPAGPFTAWDPQAGTLTLARSFDDQDEVTVSYRYREYQYTYEGYRDNAGTYHDLNLNPGLGHTYDGGRATAELLNIPLYVYLLPSAAYRVVDSLGTPEQERKIYSGTRFTNSFLRWERTSDPTANSGAFTLRPRFTFGHSYYGSAQFVSDLPVDTATTTSVTGQVLANFPCAAVLAKLYVTSAAGIESTELTDTRVRGGGIPPAIQTATANLPGNTRREVETYWDEAGWDGQPVPLAGTLLVELPAGLLTGDGDYAQFSHEEIEALVQRHVAAGIRVIIRYV